MTQPLPSGSNPAAWGLPAALPATQAVPAYGAPGRELFYVRSPVTGDVRGVSAEEAQSLVFRAGWEPVVEPSAVRLLERQVARDVSSPLEGALYGAARGLSGGLVEGALPQGDEPGAMALQGVREAHPGAALLGEIGASLLPLSKALGAARYASPVAAAAGLGEGIAGAAEGAGGLARLGARVAGTAAEGGILGSTYEVGQSQIEDTPLTAQKLASGFLAGAIPGALIGLPVGAMEGLGARFARRSEALRQEVELPAVSDKDMLQIAHREHGVAAPGLMEEVQAMVGRDPLLSPDARALINDKGPVGAKVLEQLINAPALREQAEQQAAAGLNAVRDLDEKAIEGWIHGKPKKDLIRKWLAGEGGVPEADVDQALADALRVEGPGGTVMGPEVAARAPKVERLADAVAAAAERDPEMRQALGQVLLSADDDLRPALRQGLAARSPEVSEAISGSVRAANPAAREAFDRIMAGTGAAAAWRSRGLELLDSLGTKADAMLGVSPGVLGQSRAEARKVRDLIANARAQFAKGDRVDAFAALDELKGRLGPHAKPDAWLGADDNVARFVRSGYEDVRQTLEDEGLWGRAAAGAQRDINALLHRRLARAGGYFNHFFEDAGVPHPKNPWVNQRVATPEKVRKALAGIVDPDKSDALAMFKGHVAETRELAQKMKEHYALEPSAVGDVDALLKGVDDAEKGLDRAVLFARREAQAKALFSDGRNLLHGGARWLALGLLGWPGFAAVQGANMIANPGQRIFMRAVLERALRNSESRIARAIVGLVTGKSVRFASEAVTSLAARGSASLLHERDPKARAEAYASSLAELTKLASPTNATAMAQKAIPFAAGTVPGAAQNLGAMLSRAAQYVLSKAPVHPKLTPRGIEVDVPSDAEIYEWENVWSGAMDPVSAVEDAAAGEGSLEAMKAAEHVAPELIQQIRSLTLTEIGHQEVPYERVVDLSIVLNVPLDSTMEPEYIQAQQMLHAARFKESEQLQSRRTGGEDGVNRGYETGAQTKADKLESDTAPE